MCVLDVLVATSPPLIIYAARTTQITCLWPCNLYIRRTHSPQLFILLEQPKLHVCGPVTCTINRRTRSAQLFIVEQHRLHVCGPVTCTINRRTRSAQLFIVEQHRLHVCGPVLQLVHWTYL